MTFPFGPRQCKDCGEWLAPHTSHAGTCRFAFFPTVDREPTDDEIYNAPGYEGGIAYGPDDSPGSLGENDWRL